MTTVTVPEDMTIRWADAAAVLAEALRAGASAEDLVRAALPYTRASLALMQQIEEITDASQAPKLHLVT